MITDAHIHLKELSARNGHDAGFILENDYQAVVSCHSMEDIEFAENFGKKLLISFGVHPQDPDPDGLKTLEKLLEEKRIDAVGEIGFDRYSTEFKEKFDQQKVVFEYQLDLSLRKKMPIVLHIRKSFEELFRYSFELSRLPGVIFHSFSGTYEQAQFFLDRGVNAFFSFGTPILNGNKKAVLALSLIPLERILVETDAPYQPVMGENFSKAGDILKVIEKTAIIKGVDKPEVMSAVRENLHKTFTGMK
jgi:TatD DNase family protein